MNVRWSWQKKTNDKFTILNITASLGEVYVRAGQTTRAESTWKNP